MKNNIGVVIMPMGLPWDWTTDYYEQTAQILSKKTLVMCVDLSTPEHVVSMLKEHKKNNRVIKINERLFIFRPIDILPFRRFRLILKLNNALRVISVFLYALWKNPYTLSKKNIIWICDPRFSYFASLLRSLCTIVYDVIDYNRGIQPTKLEKIRISQQDIYLTRIADIVAVNSKTLFSIYYKERRDIFLVPQGFRYSQFKSSSTTSYQIYNPQKKKIVGYVGGLNYRVDFERIISIAKKLPNCLFVLVGKVQLDVESETKNKILKHIHSLQSIPNIQIITDATKKQIPSLIRSFDVGIIPYSESLPFNIYCFPMKLFEYFYFSKPVVSSFIYELKYYPAYVSIARTTTEWVYAIKRKINFPLKAHERIQQRKLAVSNSWETKIQKVYSLIK